jgi:predicted kinase
MRPSLFVIVGLPAAGKTTRAREIEARENALRLTPDEWLIPLFGDADAGGKRDVVEGRFLWLARRALRLGISVVLDFGFWSRDERSALKDLAAEEGAACVLVYLPIGHDEQKRRIVERLATSRASTFVVTDNELAEYRKLFQEPDEMELRTADPGPAPTGYSSWDEWIQRRWPSAVEG